MRDRLQQLRPPALLLGLLLACACACAGKGAAGTRSQRGSAANAQQVLRASFGAHAPVQRARIALALSLAPLPRAPAAGAAQSLSLRLAGAFEVAREGSPALFELRLELRRGAGRQLRLELHASRRSLAIELGGRRLQGSTAALQTLRRGFTEALAGGGLAEGAQAWVTQPRLEGSQRLGGVLVEHLTGVLDAQRFGGAARRLLALLGSLAALLGAPLPAPVLSAAPAGARGRASLYSGERDHIPRRLELLLPLAAPAARGRSARYTLAVSLRLDDVNSPRALVG